MGKMNWGRIFLGGLVPFQLFSANALARPKPGGRERKRQSGGAKIVGTALVAGLAGTLLATTATCQAPASAVPTVKGSTEGNLRVLFIGNSFTHMNDLPGLTAQLAASARPPRTLETEFVGEGGADLKRHWEAGRALEAIRKGKWDYVVLQERGSLGAEPEYARLFDAEIKKAGARTVFFLTWARQDSPQDLLPLANAFASVAGELKAQVAPVGIAWLHALQENPKFVLHYDDGSHPSPAGSYLAACVFYALLFSSTPEGLSHANLSAADAAFLQRIAWKTAQAHQRAQAAGKVLTSEIPILEGKPAAPAPAPATPAALERGRAILEAAQKAAGGLERLRGLKDVSVTISGKAKAPEPQGEVAFDARETFVFPGVVRSEMQAPGFGSVVRFFDGNTGWEQSPPRGVRDMTDYMTQFWRAEVIRNTFNLLRAQGEFSVQFEKRERVGEIEADVILIRKEGESVRLFVEPASGTLLKKAYRGRGTGGSADIEQIYFDYREVSGIQFPFRIEITQNGFPLVKLSINDVKINTGLDPAELGKKPQ